jgi:hypothetical protein
MALTLPTSKPFTFQTTPNTADAQYFRRELERALKHVDLQFEVFAKLNDPSGGNGGNGQLGIVPTSRGGLGADFSQIPTYGIPYATQPGKFGWKVSSSFTIGLLGNKNLAEWQSALGISGSTVVPEHNLLSGLQGGIANQYYHLSESQFSTISAGLVGSILGTANQVLANGTFGVPQTGPVVLTLPQDIATTSDVQFAVGAFTNVNTLTPAGSQAINLNGVSSVQQRFQVDGVSIGDIGSGNIQISGGSASDFGIGVRGNNNLLMVVNSLESGRFTSTGFQGAIGATTPSTGNFTTVSANDLIFTQKDNEFLLASGGSGVAAKYTHIVTGPLVVLSQLRRTLSYIT